MSDYSNSCVYKISCKDENIKEVYIGSTTNLNMRKLQHKYRCNNEKDKKYNYNVYNFIRSNGGYDNWQFDVLEQLNCNNKTELHTRERYHIELHDNILNRVIPTRSSKEYYQDNKDILFKKQKAYNEKNKEEINKQRKNFYNNNKDILLKKSKIYREENKEKIKERKKKIYQNNKEIILEKCKIYRENNKEKKSITNKAYREKNKEKIRETKKKYYENNKEIISKKQSEYSKQLKHCDVCNCDVGKLRFLRHTRSKKHIKNSELNLNMLCKKIEKI